MIYGVIMAGGRGERFWPLSRISRPKQFLQLTSNKTMLEETIDRVGPVISHDHIRIVTGQSMTDLILTDQTSLSSEHILTEPFGRNTALAIGLAAIHLDVVDEHAVMVVLSADHLVRPQEKLLQILADGAALASREDKLITIGIVPTRPETGYGYIRVGEEFETVGDSKTYEVAAFVEKPKVAVAQEYYYSRRYLWNSGMFIWSVKSILKAIQTCQPEMYDQLMRYREAIGTADELTARKQLYDDAISISIDYAVLEKAENVLTIKADIVWDDIGSWNSLERYKDRDSENNVLIGDSVVLDTYETTVYNDEEGLVALLGVSDLVVVRSGDITLVAHKTKTGEIKKLLARLQGDDAKKKFL